jgi:hypothetical protein
MPEKLLTLGCVMSLKLYFWHSHLDYFPENLRALSEEKGDSIRTSNRWKEGARVDGMTQ